jgi:hypothetical protein
MSQSRLILQACRLVCMLLVGITTCAMAPSLTKAEAPSKIPRSLPPTTPPTFTESTKTLIYLPSVRTAPAPQAGVFWADQYLLEAGECTTLHTSLTLLESERKTRCTAATQTFS